jgi:hypothetical protein
LPYLPYTISLTSSETLHTMLRTYSFVYIKPVNGMAGKGIYRLERKNSSYLLQYQSGQKTISKHFKKLDEAWAFLTPRVKEKYIVQQGIDLATFNKKMFDIRLLAQKNGRGEWDITGMGVRLAGSGKITTHVPRGGSIQSLATIFPSAFPEKSEDEMKAAIRQMALSIVRSLETRWPALGEVSMDIGIDKGGRAWFIEANAKPGKFDEPHIRKLSLKRIVEYAQHQSNFIVQTGGGPYVHPRNYT